MELTSELVVRVEDATFYFDEIAYKDYLEIQEASKQGTQEKHIFSKLRRVEGLTRDGDPVGVDGLRSLEIPASLVFRVVSGYWQEMRKALGLPDEEVETKKELVNGEILAPSSSAS